MPSLRTTTRAAATGAVLSALVASVLTFVAPPASAITRDPITISEGEVVRRSFPGVAGNNPAGEAHTPDVCAASAYCDVIPLQVVVPPGKDPDDEYFVEIEVVWETSRGPSDPVLFPNGYTTNDMDMYVYTDPATAEEAESRGHSPDGASDPWVSSGATGDTPERALIFKPRGAYSIVIVNYVGVNRGYDMEVTWFNETIPSPFEKLAEEFAPPAATPAPVRPTPTTSTTVPATTEIAVGAPSTTTPTLDVAEDLDPSLDSEDFDTSDFEDALAAPDPIDLGPVETATVRPPSGLALFFWLLALPLGIVALGGAVLMRRRVRL